MVLLKQTEFKTINVTHLNTFLQTYTEAQTCKQTYMLT